MTRQTLRLGRLTVTAGLIAALLSGCGSGSAESMIASAKEFIGKKDNKSAIIQLKNALQKAPDNAEGRFLLGKAQLDSGDLPSAEKELRRAMELNYPADSVVPALARALLGLGEYKKVVEEMSVKPVTVPEARATLLATSGLALLAMQKKDEAQKLFDAALALQPGQAEASLGVARLKAMNQDLPGALALVDQILAKTPSQNDAQFLKADLLMAQNKPDEAAKLFDAVVASQPDNVRAHTSRFMLSFAGNKLDVAATQLEAMKKVLPQHPQTHYLEAMLLLKKEDLPKAKEAIQQALKSAPGYPPALLLAGEIELRQNSPQVAVTYLQQAMTKAPNSILARRLLSVALLRSGQASRALETLKPLLQALPEDGGVQMLAGEVYLGNNDLPEAEKHFAKAVSLDSKNTGARTRLGQVKFAEGDAQAGFHELEAASGMDTGNAQADVLLAVAHLRRNEADKALAAIATLDKKLPNSPIPWNLRAGALLLKNDVAGARKSLEKALSITPTYFPAALTLARLDVQDKNWDSAKKRFETILEKDPKNPQALLALAQARAESGGKPAEVQDLLEKAVAGNPSNPEVRVALIRFLLGAKNNDKAVSSAQEAQAAFPDNPEILDTLGLAQLAAGQTNQAITSFNKLASLRPSAPAPLLRLAGIYLRDKQNELASESLRRALVLKPDLVEAQSGLVAVYTLLNRQRDAIGISRDVQRQRPKEAVGYMLEADVQASQKKWTEAASVLRTGIATARNPSLVIALNKALKADNRNADADKALADWIRDNPKEPMVRTFVAETSLNAKLYDQAFKQYKDVLAIQPKNPMVLNNMAWIAGQLKDAKAVEYAEQANTLAPNNPAILDTLGMLLMDKGDAKRGVALLQQALTIAPEAHPIRLNLAKAYAKSGQKDAAKKELEALLKLDDKNAVKQEALAFQKTL